MKQFATAVAAILLLSTAFTVPGRAQVINAVLGGTVTDPAGASIARVTVTATNVNTGIVTSGLTNEAGSFQFPNLQPGTYTLSANAAGFQTYTYNDVQLGQGQQVRLNFQLQIASGNQTVEVKAEADTALATTSASVGGVLNEQDVLSQPLASRNVLDLLALTPGVISVPAVFTSSTLNFAGVNQDQVNTTRDGVITNDGRYANGAYSGIFTSPDMVEEVRISTNQIDPSLGRGVAQVQMRTRSGGNEFHGAGFWTNNNSAFNANNYFSNLQGQPISYANRNQFGGRVGGPIKKNKLFFFVLTDDQRDIQRFNDVAMVLTDPARQGNFRYLTGPGGASRSNGNAFSTTPSVDLGGNILSADPKTGQALTLNTVNVLAAGGPNFNTIDPVWVGPTYLGKYMPHPNNYTVGDGLNTAGFQWQQTYNGYDGATGQSPNTNRNNITARIDYQINDKQKVNFVVTKEKDSGVSSQTGIPDYPAGYFGYIERDPSFYSVAWTWTITPSLLNEFRFGHKVDTWEGTSALDVGCCLNGAPENSGLSKDAQAARASYPQVNNYFAYTAMGSFGLLSPNSSGIFSTMGLYAGLNVSTPRVTISPFNLVGDTLSWIHGAHQVQFGFEIDRTSSQSANSGGIQTTRPSVTLGVGAVAPAFTSATFPGMGPLNFGTAQALAANLAGSVNSITEQYWVNSPTATDWINYQSDFLFYRTNRANAWSGFVKDNWKVNRDLTVNIGLRYDFFGAPYEDQGLAGRPAGGQSGLFGISGTNFGAMWNPNANSGALTTMQFVGPNSPNSGIGVYNPYYKNIGPSIGIAYQLPWFKRSTVLRAGYGINYIGNVDFLAVNTGVGNSPGQTLNTTWGAGLCGSPGFVNLSSLASSGVVPVCTQGIQPFAPIPLNQKSTGIYGYADNLRTPYVQSFNISLQRELTSTLTVDFNFIGNKGTELYTNQPLNDPNIFENGFLNAFNTTRAGGNAPLFDQMLNGLTIPGVGTVNGTTLTGSQALRRYSVTNQFIANGSVGQLANYFNTTTTFGGGAGGILTHAGLTPNFFVVNPQFGSTTGASSVTFIDNNGNSTYDAFQAHIAKRFSHGFTGQFAYTFSKTLGDDAAGGAYRDPRNFSLNKGLLSIDRPQLFQWNAQYELPIGANHALLGHAPHWVDSVLGGWQISSSFQLQSGVPLTLTSSDYTYTYNTGETQTANLAGQLPANMSAVTKGSNFVQYFPGLTVTAAPQPNFGGDPTLPGRFTNLEVVNSSGQPVFVNADPGTIGNSPRNSPWLRGPGLMGFNASISKVFRITESKSFTVRGDAINLTNTPQWGYSSNPNSGALGINTNIDSTSFGRITSAAGSRLITFYARFDF